MTDINCISQEIIGAAIEVHRVLGPGLLEHAYHKALEFELKSRGLKVASEVEIPIVYKGVLLYPAYRADMIVENQVIVELKATDVDNSLFYKQLLTYLRLSDKRLGLLINFNKERLIDGIKRIANNL